MKVKKQLHTEEVARIAGLTSRELADRCPDRRVTFPTSPCTNQGCPFRINESGYMNCMFVGAEAGEHTLEAVGDMIGVTREGARQIERRALIKLRLLEQFQDHGTTIRESSLAAGIDLDASVDEGPESADERDDFRCFDN